MLQIKAKSKAFVVRTPLSSAKAPVLKTKSYLPLKSKVKIQPITKPKIFASTKSLIPNSLPPKEFTKTKIFEILVGAVVSITVSTFSNLQSLMNFYDKYVDRTSSAITVADCSGQPDNIIIPKPKEQTLNFDTSDPSNWVGYGCTNDYTRVLVVQKSLNHQMNAGLVCDGKFGLGTYKAIVKFQENINGLSKDGVVGPNTWYWLLKDNGNI